MKNIKKGLVILCSIALFVNCVSQKEKQIQVKLRADIDNLLDSIIKISPSNKVYELYIDKIDPQNSNILFYIGSKSLMKENNVHQTALHSVEINGKTIKIYSGIEKYVSLCNSNIVEENNVSNNGDEVFWAIEDKKGTIKSYQTDFAYPFMPFPLKNEKDTFSKPIIRSNGKNPDTRIFNPE